MAVEPYYFGESGYEVEGLSGNLAQPEENLNQPGAYQTAASNLTAGGNITIGSISQTTYQTTLSAETLLDISWHEVSLKLLEERLQLTTNPMTRGDDIAYQVKQDLGILNHRTSHNRVVHRLKLRFCFSNAFLVQNHMVMLGNWLSSVP